MAESRLRQCHHQRVWSAAKRATVCDERDQLDDWIMAWLKTTRRDALRAGHELDDINNWTMDGALAGRQGVNEGSK